MFLTRRLIWLHPEPPLEQKVLPDWSMYFIGWIPALIMLYYIATNGYWRDDWFMALMIYFIIFPICFTFFCNIYRVRRFRELEWIWIFILLNIISIEIYGSPRWQYIVPISLLHLIFICWRAYQDPQVALLSAGIEMREGDFLMALLILQKAKTLPEGKLATSICYARMGRHYEARQLFEQVLDTEEKIEQTRKIFPELAFLLPLKPTG
jgi:hypothetical protein